jgi:uncharacterized OB-fold protein
VRATRPLPGDVVADDLDQLFWDACRDHRFLVQRCARCGLFYWPASCCTVHGSAAMEWVEASGRGQVHTYAVIHQSYRRTFLDVPYNVAVVRLDEGPLFHTSIIDCIKVEVGLRVQVAFVDYESFTLPLFRPSQTP